MKVVLVHGFKDTGKVMGKLADHLTREGHECLVPTLDPHDAREGLPMMAHQLHGILEEKLPGEERFALVGFSMGALISRYYLQELGGHERAEAFFSISGPHEGTWAAYLHSGEGVNQMRPGSSFLNDLQRSSRRLESHSTSLSSPLSAVAGTWVRRSVFPACFIIRSSPIAA
jgi:triacylglycerol lipase